MHYGVCQMLEQCLQADKLFWKYSMAEFLILAKNRTNYSIPIKAKSNCKYVCLFDMYLKHTPLLV